MSPKGVQQITAAINKAKLGSGGGDSADATDDTESARHDASSEFSRPNETGTGTP